MWYVCVYLCMFVILMYHTYCVYEVNINVWYYGLGTCMTLHANTLHHKEMQQGKLVNV